MGRKRENRGLRTFAESMFTRTDAPFNGIVTQATREDSALDRTASLPQCRNNTLTGPFESLSREGFAIE
jgi:hypothetical protein